MKKNIFLFLLYTFSVFAFISDGNRELINKSKIISDPSGADKVQHNTALYFASPIYTEDFEGVHNWVLVNGAQTNKWFVGTAVNNGGTKSLYISDNNGASNQYDITGPSITHAYTDISIPVNTTDVEFSFDWRSIGVAWQDVARVWIVPTSFIPTPGTQIFPGGMDITQIVGNLNGQPTWINYSTILDFTAFSGQSIRLVFQWRNEGWSGAQPPIAIDNVILKRVSCSKPLNVQLQNVATTTAQISWTPSVMTNGISHDYYISQTNTILNTTIPTGNVTTASAELENLMPGTQYYFWVRSNCGSVDGQSLWTGPFTFFTHCTAINLPFTETFNSDSTTDNCWTFINNNNDDVQWSTNTVWGAFEGDQFAKLPIDVSNSAGNDDYLVSPIFNFNGQYRLKYHYKMGLGELPQKFSVKRSQNGGTSVVDFTETVLAEQGYSNKQYIEKTVYLPAFTGEGAIAWYVGNSNNRQIYIDKVIIEPVPLCPEPYELVSTQVTDQSLSISWQQYGTVASWEVIILPHGQSIPTDLSTITVYSTNTTSITISDLENSTSYDVYIRAICNPIEKSNWSSVLELTTAPPNDECNNAIVIPVNSGPECIESVSGTIKAATPSNTGEVCEGNPYNDVWYEFTAVSTKHSVKLEAGFATTYIAVYKQGICEGQNLIPVACAQTDVLSLEGLTVGNTYKVRVYTSEINTDTTFNICVITLLNPVLVSETQYTVPQLVTEVLIDNPCANVSNITWSTGSNFGDVNGIGYFDKNNSSFSFEDGILLSTGDVQLAKGPGGGNPASGLNIWGGDAQLTTYINNYLNQPDQVYRNASVLEFDFVAVTEQLKFNFIFASNEYGMFQCRYSDVFAFFLTNSTTGITTNLALVPNTSDPISVVTIRKGIYSPLNPITGAPACTDANPEYFQEYYNLNGGANPLLSPINFRGLTVPMVAQSQVVPGTTYHIKLVIQDRQDISMDSAVFIEGGSFDLGNVELGGDLLVENGNALCPGHPYILNSGLNPDDYTIKWYKDNVLISGANGPTLEITQSGEYKIEAIPVNSICPLTDTIKVEIYPEIKVVFPKNIEICVFNQLIPIVDFTINENEMLSLIPDLSDIEVAYYKTETAAELEDEVITDPENYVASGLPEEIFVRIDDNKTGCHRIVSFKLVAKEVVDLKNPEKIVACVYDGIPVSLDLTSVRSGIVSQLTNPNVMLYYYETYQNAIDGIGAIASPQNYQPDTLPATIYIRFTDRATGCELMTSVDIVASPEITPVKVEDIIICTKYTLPKAPEGYFYSTEAFGKGELIISGTVYGPGYYVVYLNVQNVNNCVFSSSYTIEVIDCSIPKGISPNGDGLNDTFDLTNYHPLEVLIYNREGMEVYAYGPGYTNQWYGQNKQGEPLPDDTYFYKIVTDTELFTGYVQLIREIK